VVLFYIIEATTIDTSNNVDCCASTICIIGSK